MNVKEDIRNAGQLQMVVQAFKLSIEIYMDMLERGYVPTNAETARKFLANMGQASEELVTILKEHTEIVQAHVELDKI